MRLCTWRRGCSVTIANVEELCSYHGKIMGGLISSTRGEGGAFVVEPVDLTAAEQATAAVARADYWARWERAEQERRDRARREREAAWRRGLGHERTGHG